MHNSMRTWIFPKLHAYLNEKRYKRYLLKAQNKGIEQKFLEVWNLQVNNLTFKKQTGYESRSAYLHAIQHQKMLRKK